MTHVDVEQGSDEWKQERIGYITASHAADILMKPTTAGYQKYLTQIALERITGVYQEGYTNQYMQDGNDYEPVARTTYALQKGVRVNTSGFYKHDTLPAGCSLDGEADEVNIEIKSVENHIHTPTLLHDKISGAYIKQMQFQLWITEREACDFISYAKFWPLEMPHSQMKVVRVERDDIMIAKIEEAVYAFDQDVEALVTKLEGMA